MTVAGVSVFSDGFLWFFGYWIPAFAGMTVVVLVGAARMTGALRGFCLEYIIFFAGGGGKFTLLDDFEGGGVWGFGLVRVDWWRRQYSKII